MRKSLLVFALAATVPLASMQAQFNLSPTDGGGNWQVACTVIATDAPPTGPCNGVFSTATRVTASPQGWVSTPVAGPNGNAYYISPQADASIWPTAPSENPHYNYDFRTSFFVLGGFTVGSVDLNVFWLDNYFGGWSLNGSAFSSAGMTPPPLGPNGGNWQTAFDLSFFAGFQPGWNTLDIQLQGNGRTDGILAQGTYDYTATPQETVPEPATMTLLATGLVGMIGAGLRRRRKA